jgi:hypothetical protein
MGLHKGREPRHTGGLVCHVQKVRNEKYALETSGRIGLGRQVLAVRSMNDLVMPQDGVLD